MKNTKKIFVYALCILLSVLIASATLMAGATDSITESTTASEKTTIPATEVISTTEQDITDAISEFVSENDLQDDLSEVGNGIKSFSAFMTDLLNDFISVLESSSEKLVEFLKQVFRIASFD